MKKTVLAALFAIILLGGFLRFYNISNNPPGLYVDEAGIAYNAYQILTTGKDEYGTPFPLTFRSFDDYKMPGYIYLTALSLKIFGKNEFAIRAPSALAGTLTIAVIFFLLRTLLGFHKFTEKHKDIFSLLGALVLAILPWHLLISRGGFEVTVALFFYTWGLLLAVRFWVGSKRRDLVGSILLFSLSMYTYHSYRIIAPLTILFGILLAWKQEQKRNLVLKGAVLFFLISLPLFIFSVTSHGMARFTQTSAFADDPFKGLSQLLVNVLIYFKNYYSYFSFTYLFSYGDQINRHQVNNFGLLYIWQLPYIILGLYFLTKTKNKIIKFVVLFILLVGPIPAAFARPSPHSLRFLLGTIIFTIMTILGIHEVSLLKSTLRSGLYLLTILLACVEFAYYTHFYFVQYPKLAILDWGGGCKAVAQKIYNIRNEYAHIYVDKNLGCVSEYFSFYIPNVKITYLSPNQTIASTTEKVLYVRPFYGSNTSQHLIYTYRLPVQNNPIFAEFWQL